MIVCGTTLGERMIPFHLKRTGDSWKQQFDAPATPQPLRLEGRHLCTKELFSERREDHPTFKKKNGRSFNSSLSGVVQVLRFQTSFSKSAFLHPYISSLPTKQKRIPRGPLLAFSLSQPQMLLVFRAVRTQKGIPGVPLTFSMEFPSSEFLLTCKHPEYSY
ncbi:hypothetical protein CDAR_524801 [Caerostris darwini]|uniref:Uncharacterized protein n=1 Tax=Caerostris darwini TaxID=1538125 RepID=A0AAV4R0H7_9ARAC|nr:hypothetical protein CDAR_524801 [Caerostris darwini]